MFGLVPFRSHGNITKKGDAFDRLFDYMLEQPFGALNKLHSGLSTFKVDVRDKGDSYELTAELPGVKKEDIDLRYEKDYLTISACRNEEKEEKQDNYVCRERHMGRIQRSFFISNIDENKLSASFKDGILTLEMPKLEGEKPSKQIEIK